uniref:Uncharacterized protein n=1 Tax=Schistocephalus solidus TaxID=70667 RepID=A0A0X3PPL7_SCHSO
MNITGGCKRLVFYFRLPAQIAISPRFRRSETMHVTNDSSFSDKVTENMPAFTFIVDRRSFYVRGLHIGVVNMEVGKSGSNCNIALSRLHVFSCLRGVFTNKNITGGIIHQRKRIVV